MINFYEGKNSYIKNDFQKDINDLYIHLYKIVLIEIFFFSYLLVRVIYQIWKGEIIRNKKEIIVILVEYIKLNFLVFMISILIKITLKLIDYFS